MIDQRSRRIKETEAQRRDAGDTPRISRIFADSRQGMADRDLRQPCGLFRLHSRAIRLMISRRQGC